jgi:hypothetical protein
VSYIQTSGVPRSVFAEERLVVPFTGGVVQMTAANVAGCLMARARLEGGPVRFKYLTHPSSTLGTPIYDSDVVEWCFPELSALLVTGGFVLAASGSADASLWVSYYR